MTQRKINEGFRGSGICLQLVRKKVNSCQNLSPAVKGAGRRFAGSWPCLPAGTSGGKRNKSPVLGSLQVQHESMANREDKSPCLKCRSCPLDTWGGSLWRWQLRQGIEGRAFKEGQRMRWLDDTISSMYVSLSQLWEIVTDRKAWQAAVRGVGRSRTLLSD